MRYLILLSVAFFTITNSGLSQKISYTIPDSIKAGDTIELSLTVEKGKITGFAKLEVYIPIGFNPILEKQKGASMICSENIVKFIWIDIPASDKVEVIIRMITDPRLSGQKDFFGSFHYLANNERKKQTLPLIQTWVNNKDKENIPQSLMALYKYKKNVAEPTPASNTTAVAYRIQLGAFSKKVPSYILSEFYEPVSRISEDFHNGLYKYTIGDFKDKNAALEFCQKYGISDAFVVIYKNGKRQ